MRYKRILLSVFLAISLLFFNSVTVSAASKKNTSPPAPTLSYSPTTPTNGNVTVTVYYPSTAVTKQYRLGESGVWTTYTAPVAVTSNINFYARYQNRYGYWSAEGVCQITNIDKTSPAGPTFNASATAPTNQDVSVTINYSTDSTVKQYRIGSGSTWASYSAPVTLSSNGTIYARSSDAAGNWSNETSYTVSNIDKLPPANPTFTTTLTDTTSQTVTIAVEYTSDSTTRLYKTGSSGVWTDYSVPVTMSINDTIYAKAGDAAGNWTPEVSYTAAGTADTTPPGEPVITASTANLTDTPVVISISYSQDSVIKQYRTGDSTVWTDYTSPVSLSSNTTVYAKAADSAGNWSMESSYSVTNIRKTVMGYTVKTSSTDMTSYNSITANSGSLNEISTATYGVDGYGNLSGAAPADQINYSNSNGIRTSLVVSNNFDSTIAAQLLESPANRQTLENNILNTLKANNYTGVNIDIENIPAADRTNFTTFMSEIYGSLKPLGYEVSVAVPAKTYDSSSAAWNYAFDYKSLASYADYLMIMAYDEHYPGGTPGAIASIGWVTNVVDYALTVVPKEKIILGLAAYGYDWYGTTTKAYSINSCYSLASQYGATIYLDSTTKGKYFSYTLNGVSHTVWFEDADTIAYKLDLVNSRDLKGIGIWRLGLENTNYWATIDSKLGK